MDTFSAEIFCNDRAILADIGNILGKAVRPSRERSYTDFLGSGFLGLAHKFNTKNDMPMMIFNGDMEGYKSVLILGALMAQLDGEDNSIERLKDSIEGRNISIESKLDGTCDGRAIKSYHMDGGTAGSSPDRGVTIDSLLRIAIEDHPDILKTPGIRIFSNALDSRNLKTMGLVNCYLETPKSLNDMIPEQGDYIKALIGSSDEQKKTKLTDRYNSGARANLLKDLGGEIELIKMARIHINLESKWGKRFKDCNHFLETLEAIKDLEKGNDARVSQTRQKMASAIANASRDGVNVDQTAGYTEHSL